MNYENLPPDYKQTFSRYTNLLKVIGIHIFESPGISKKSRIRLIAFNIVFIPFVFGQFTLVAKLRSENFLEGALVVPVSVVFILDLAIMATALLKKSDIKDMFLEIGELWPTGLRDGDEKAVIMRNWMRRMGTLLNAYFTYAAVNLALFEIIPLVTTAYNVIIRVDEYVLPFQMVNLWPVDSVLTYMASYTCELWATVPCQLCLFIPYDLVIITMTSNVSILFRLLQVDLRDSIQNIRPTEHTVASDPDSFHNIVALLKTHQKLLRISEQLNHIFGLVIFIHIALSAVLICFFGFLTVAFGGVAETIANLLSVWNAVITIFLMSLSGQLLTDTSGNIGDAAYQSSWYGSDMKVKKIILFIIIRSQKASYLSALGFSKMTLRSFSKIMSSAWTYFSLLVQMYGGK